MSQANRTPPTTMCTACLKMVKSYHPQRLRNRCLHHAAAVPALVIIQRHTQRRSLCPQHPRPAPLSRIGIRGAPAFGGIFDCMGRELVKQLVACAPDPPHPATWSAWQHATRNPSAIQSTHPAMYRNICRGEAPYRQ